MLKALVRIHLEIDPPTRRPKADEPDWIFRLRKVCLHLLATQKWELDIEALHAMATELRAAYVQMDAVWRCLPNKLRLYEFDDASWAREARNGLLATYDHPTAISLGSPASQGGFGAIDDPGAYVWLALWLNQLGLGYGPAIGYLAEVLGNDQDITGRIVEAMSLAPTGNDI